MVTNLYTHSLVQHFVTILRDKHTEAEAFRAASEAVTRMIVLEAAKSLSLKSVQVETPVETTDGQELEGGTVFVPILRAGIGMLKVSLEMIPHAAVGFVGLERDEATAIATCYYSKMPDMSNAGQVFVIDPMLATGGSAVQTIDELKSQGVTRLTMLCVIAAPEGIAEMELKHPDVPIITGVIDRELNDQKYICPGLGDFGDRLFIT